MKEKKASKQDKNANNAPIEDKDIATDVEIEESAPVLTELELLEQKYAELNDRYLRVVAEFDNFRKRTQREKDEIYSNCTANTVEKFIPVWDNFERSSEFACGTEEYTKGIELIRSGFTEIMSGFKVSEFGEVGDSFDANIHHAISHVEDENLGENVISAVMQKGFKIGDKILRYAMVQTAN